MTYFNQYRISASSRNTWRAPLALAALIGFTATALIREIPVAAQSAVSRFAGPTSSQPLALTANNAFLAVVNPDNNSVSLFDVRADRNRKLTEIPVQTEPNGVAILPAGGKIFVANTVSGTVSVMRANLANGVILPPHRHIPVGTEPYGLVLTPNGSKLYVSNARSNSVSVIDTVSETVIRTIANAGVEPRGMAITNDGDNDDLDETLYVTQFLSLQVPGRVDGADNAKTAHVTVIPTATDTVQTDVVVNPIADTGFKAAGDALARVAPGPNFTFTTGAYPNQLNAAAIRGNFLYLPNTGASPNGPFRFDVNTHSLLAVIDRTTRADAGQTINMHLAVQNQVNPEKRFVTVPWTMAFKNGSDQGYVVSAASNIVVKVEVNPGTGAPTVQNDPLDPTRVLEIPTGKNPRGIVINSTDTRAYVMNYVSRDVTVIDLTSAAETVKATMQSAALPLAGSQQDKIQVGKELYHTSIGVFDPPTLGAPAPSGRMSRNGWGACSGCHPFGLSDNVVWIFPSGPKRTIPQHTDFDLTDPTRAKQRMLNWSAERDEEEDFELNIRAVSGGGGLIVQADGVTPELTANIANLRPLANANRPQLKVRGQNAWDSIKAYIQFGIRPPISPLPKTDPDVVGGRALFISANCQSCHGGAQWTVSQVRFTPPPDAALINNGQIFSELRTVGTFDPTFANEVNANGAPSVGVLGFVPPSLLSGFAFTGNFFHNGAALSLTEVLNNVTHRAAGTSGVDTLANAADRAKLEKFLLSIDAATVPIP